MKAQAPRLSFCTDCPAGAMTERGLIIHRAVKHGDYQGGGPLHDRHDPDLVQINVRLDPELHSALLSAAKKRNISQAELIRRALRTDLESHV